MSSFTSFFSNTPSSSSSALVVTQEEFNAFHKIDRTLFTRLVFGLNRDMNQYKVIGFLFLLEQNGYARNVIAYLVSLPDEFIDAVANEVGVCLKFLYDQDFSSTFFRADNNDENSSIPLIIFLTGGRLTLRLIHQNRKTFHLGLTKNLGDICIRAFADICVRAERYNREKLLAIERERVTEDMKKIRLGVQQETTNRLSDQQEMTNRLIVGREIIPLPPPPPPPPAVGEETKETTVETETANDEETGVAADDRTVFLTFSKGYPISKEEVRVYMTRRFGEVIEEIEMQEVEENEQPLYAKMVLTMRCASKMEEIVSERGRNKYTINGKHVWARKYVPRNSNSPASSSSHI